MTSVYGLALFESWILESTEQTLKLAGQRLVHKVDTVRAEVETTASRFARSSNSMLHLWLSMIFFTTNASVHGHQRNFSQVDAQRELLGKQVELAIAKTPELRVAYVDLDSRVLLEQRHRSFS